MASPKRKNAKSSAISYYDSASDTYPDVASATPLPVNIISGAGSGGTAMTDDAAFTPGTTSVTPAAGTYRSVRDSVNDGDAGAFAMTATRAIYAAIETPAGDSAMDDTNDALRVNIVAGSASGTEYTEGATDATITGTAILMEGAADTLLPVQGTVADGLLVNLGTNNDVTVTTSALPTGAATSAKQDTIIGHVDGIEGLLTTIDADTSTLAAIDYVIGSDVASLGVTGGGLEATALRVTIANDSTGVVSVDDNGGSITVDGSVTANAGTNLNTSALALEAGGNLAAAAASLSVLDDWDETNRAAVNTIAGQVGVQGGSGAVTALTQRVVLATDVALPAGTNAIGKLAANSGVDIGDVDVASIAAGSNIIGRVGHDITGIGHGVTTVTTAGTDVALAASTACKRVTIQAQTDNTSGIAVGTSGVDATIATGTGIYLNPGDAIELEIDNLADVYIDSLVNGEGVRYVYYT